MRLIRVTGDFSSLNTQHQIPKSSILRQATPATSFGKGGLSAISLSFSLYSSFTSNFVRLFYGDFIK
jgi:hypothetical protein